MRTRAPHNAATPAGDRLDVRATLRASHTTSGDPVRRVHRRATQRPRTVVLIADVSGSMEPYARVYLHLMRGAVQALGSEAFVFATRLTRLTRVLHHTNPDVAYRRRRPRRRTGPAAPASATRSRRSSTSTAVGGSPAAPSSSSCRTGGSSATPSSSAGSMEQLSRLAFHIIWVNPRKAATGYKPLVGGMAAALPYVDTFVSGHSLRALEDVLTAIRDAAVDGRRVHRVRPLPDVVEFEPEPAPTPSATPGLDRFPTGRLVAGTMNGS